MSMTIFIVAPLLWDSSMRQQNVGIESGAIIAHLWRYPMSILSIPQYGVPSYLFIIMVQLINEFTAYCKEIGILDEAEGLKEVEDLEKSLFMHLLSLNRNSLQSLANRLVNNWKDTYIEIPTISQPPQQFEQTPLPQNLIPNHKLYNLSIQREENQILRQQMNEQLKMKDCTFHPQISVKSKELDMRVPVHQRLSKYGVDTRIKQQINQDIKQKSELQTCTFRPQVNDPKNTNVDPFNRLYQNALSQRANKKQPEEIQYSHHPQLVSQPIYPCEYVSVPVEKRLYDNFFDVQQNQMIKQELQSQEELKECTFTPQINNSVTTSNSKVFDRLYHHSHVKSSTDQKDCAPTMVNRKSEKLIKNTSQDQSQYVSQFSVEGNPFDRLYQEHRRIEKKKKMKENEFHSQITFKPQTYRK